MAQATDEVVGDMSEANFLYILVDIDKKIIYYLINDSDNCYQLIDEYIK